MILVPLLNPKFAIECAADSPNFGFGALVSRFRRLYPLAARLFYKRRNQRDTSNSMNLVRLLDLTFLLRIRGNTGRNVKSAALEYFAARFAARRGL